jgi:signal transduction histidine kinase
MPSLFVIQGRDQGKRFELREPTVRVGRDPDNTVQLHDTEVSRYHVELRWRDDRYELVDLGSSNGTYVNSQLAARQLLSSGDRVQLGRTLLIFTAGALPAAHERGDSVDIVGADQPAATGSRIVHSFAPEPATPGIGTEADAPHAWLARARSNLDVMYHTALAASHTLDIDQLLQRILELIFEWVAADRGCVMLRDRDTDALVPAARKDRHGTAEQRMEISRTILDYVLQHREGVLTSDAREDDRWDSAASIVRTGVREAICVPMQGRYGVVGAVYLDTYTPPGRFLARPTQRFTEEHLKLMVAIGHQAALAVEDTSYYSALVQAERLAAIGQTIATLSHHIKNILQGIRGGSYLIEEGLKSAEFEVVSKGWAIVDKNQEKISNLVMDMLSFSKEREPEMVPADINQVVSDVVELMESRAADAGVTLQWRPDPLLPLLTFDPDALHRAVLNVVTNAIDACESVEQGCVTVRTELAAAQQQLRIYVEDNGVGIEPADLAKIFSVFESRKGSRGTGLGLPVSQKIMREHEGDITVESQAQHGSRFCLSMPAIPPPADAASAPQVRATAVRTPHAP